MPINQPPGILPKADGIVSKIRPVPAATSRPCRKTIGNTTRPASNATIVSALTITTADRGIETDRSRYAPKETIPAMATPIEKKAWPTAASATAPVTLLKSGLNK